jgi:hypothetical protein
MSGADDEDKPGETGVVAVGSDKDDVDGAGCFCCWICCEGGDIAGIAGVLLN